MFSEQLRSRLEALHTTPPVGVSRTQSVAEVDRPLQGHTLTTAWGAHWQIQQPIQAVWPTCSQYVSHLLQANFNIVSDPDADKYARDIGALQAGFPHHVVYLDLETCGFAGSMVFLIGLLHWRNEQLTLTQLWARDYAEEKAILQSLWSIVQAHDVLVTFNGKSFDWPQIHDRSTLHHLGRRSETSVTEPRIHAEGPTESFQRQYPMDVVDPRPEPWHVDLLHHARRRWKRQLPNCRLQTLERFICGRNRVGDLPGREIPNAYHDYVRSGATRQVQAILHHNALDLITLLQLSLLFLQPRKRANV